MIWKQSTTCISVRMFKSAGNGSVSGLVSGHRVSNMRIQVGLNLSSPGESRLFCTFSNLPDGIPPHHLILIMSISSWPFAWLLAVEASTDKQLNLFLEIAEVLEIEGTVQFENKGNRKSKALSVNYKAQILEKHIVEIEFTFDGEIPSTVNDGTIELGEYDVMIRRSMNEGSRHVTEVITPVYEVAVIRNILINGEPFAIGMQMHVSSQKWVERMLLPAEQRVSIHERNVVVDSRKNEGHLYLTSRVSTPSQLF